MADKPETLEETQARLARVEQGAVPPPPVSVPIPAMTGPPGTPYGPNEPGAPDLAQVGGVGEFGTMPARPDPYATSHLAPQPAPPVVTPRRPGTVVLVALAAVALVAIAGVVAYLAFDDPSGSSGPDDEPVYSEEWQQFPGVSYSDPNEALTQPSYEEVAAATDAVITQYRDALTAEFGLVWSQIYEPYSDVESNGYGGDSMLYYFDTGSWQGQVQLDDPGARERIYELFGDLSLANGGESVLLRNEIYSDNEASAREQFGAVELDDQALWSFLDSYPEFAYAYVSSDVIDRNIPVDSTFTGDYMFTYDSSSDTLYVTVDGYAGGLLKEADRAAFEDALEPYHGDYEP